PRELERRVRLRDGCGPAQVRARLAAVVEAEHRLDQRRELARDVDDAAAAAEATVAVRVLVELHRERGAHRGGAAGENDGAARRIDRRHLEPGRPGELL